MLKRHLLPVACLLLVVVPSVVAAEEDAPAEVDFNTTVAPILTKYCVGCHAADAPESGLVLASFEGLLAGGDRGAAIVPGDSARSRLLRVLTGEAKPAMPPEGSEAPTAEEVAVLKTWVDAGAKGPDGPADPTLLVTPHVEFRAAARHPIHAAAFLSDGKQIALAGYQQIQLASIETRAVERVLDGLHGAVNDVRLSTDGRVLIAAAGEPGLFGEATLWSVADGSLVSTFRGHTDSLYAAALSPDGTRLATAGYDKQIIVWDVATGEQLHVLTGHNGCVYDLEFRPDGKVLASASADRTVKLWDAASGERLDTLGQSLKELYAVAFNPDGQWLVAGGVDNRIRAWKVSPSAREGSNPLIHARFAHQGAIVELAYSPDGKTLVSAAEDRTVKLWDTETLVERRLLEEQSDWPSAVAVSPDNGKVVVARLDGGYALYDSGSGETIRPPAPELASVEPRAVDRNQASRLRLKGKQLAGATKIQFNHPRLQASVVPPESGDSGDGTEITIELAAAPNVPPGKYEVAVVTAGGTSGKQSFYVDNLPQPQESEPNSAPSEAMALTQPTGCWGTIAAMGDVDNYMFTAKAGEQLVLELAARSLGSKLNGRLTLYDTEDRVVASNNGFEGGEDPLMDYLVPADGTYRLAVGSLELEGSEDHWYRVTVGSVPYVTGVYPLSIPAGAEAEIELTGFNLPDDATVKVRAGDGGEVKVPIDSEKYRSRKAFRVVVGNLPEVREAEPNDLPEEATALTVPGTGVGRLWRIDANASDPDTDLFAFDAKQGETWLIETDATRRGSPVDTRIEVLDAAGEPVERLLLEATRDSWIEFRGFDSNAGDIRVANWEEMELNDYLYFQGEVTKIFRHRRGPDSGFVMYSQGGKRIGYFDTSATAHALEDPCYVVRPHSPGTTLVPNGLPVFTLYYANDDDGERELDRDSRLTFTAPADGRYLVRVSDVRDMNGPRFAYRLIVRRPEPDFRVTVSGANPSVRRGGGRSVTLVANRIDGFDGPIKVDIEGLPPGFHCSTPIVIPEGHYVAQTVVYADAEAPAPTEENANVSTVVATAEINGSPVTHEAGSLGKVALQMDDKVLVRLEPAEITIAPGQSVAATLKVVRNDFKEPVSFELQNMPHGVIVDNIGLNGVLILPQETERQIFISARNWVPETTREVHALATTASGESSPPVVLHVRDPDVVAKASETSEP